MSLSTVLSIREIPNTPAKNRKLHLIKNFQNCVRFEESVANLVLIKNSLFGSANDSTLSPNADESIESIKAREKKSFIYKLILSPFSTRFTKFLTKSSDESVTSSD